MKTRVEHDRGYVIHVMEIPEEDVEAKYLIPAGWKSAGNEYAILVIRHETYICICKIVESKIGGSLIVLADSVYPEVKKRKLPFLKGRESLKAKDCFQKIIEVLCDTIHTSGLTIQKGTAMYRNRGCQRECMSAFADLSMDFEILGPILEYCESAIETFKRVTGETEVKPDGGGDPGPDKNPLGQQPGSGDAHQDRQEHQEEPGQCLPDSL